MSIISKFFKKSLGESQAVITTDAKMPIVEQIASDIHLELPDGMIVTFDGEVLDTTSSENIQKLKHNLEVLIQKTKQEGIVKNFKLIREDDFFPYDDMWMVSSKNTCMQRQCLGLSYAVKKKLALEKAGVNNVINGISLPVDDKVVNDALKGVDKYLASIYMPTHFRSTKHFTINTPLGVTGDYNSVSTDRNFIVIDDINNFISSGYAYSIAYHDAYLDVTHKGLPISPNAVILINQSKYEQMQNDEKLLAELKKRRVIIFKGDETLAINMVLTEMGVLPSQIGMAYATYDEDLKDIIDSSIKALASSNDLFFDKSHAGKLTPDGGHFSNYYDDMNFAYNAALEELATFLANKFPEHKSLFNSRTVSSGINSEEIVDLIGAQYLLDAINEFNQVTLADFNARYSSYQQDRKNITPEIDETFKMTIRLINTFYMQNVDYRFIEEKNKLENLIRIFLQGDTVSEQLLASREIIDLINSMDLTNENDELKLA